MRREVSWISSPSRARCSSREAFASAEDFYELVAEDLDRSPDEVEATVRAVFAAMRAQLAEQDADDVAGLLPPELEPLWRRPS